MHLAEKKYNTIVYTTISVIIIGLISKIFGFLRELLLAHYFGTSQIVDIYLMSIAIPSLFFGFLPAIGVGVTPVYYSIKLESKNSFLNHILSISVLIAFLCICITYIFSDKIVFLVANGFDHIAKEYTKQFLLVTIWSVLLNTPIQILVSYLNCLGFYISSNITNLTVSIIQAIFVIIAAKIDTSILPYGYLLPFVVQFIWLYRISYKNGFRLNPEIKFEFSEKKLFILVIPIFISNMLVDLNGFIDKYLASGLPEGRISSLNYAYTLRSVFYTLCTTVVSTIFYPQISRLVAEKRDGELLSIVNKLIDILIILFLPLQVFFIICSKDIISIIYMRGNFNQNSLELTVSPFIMYMISLVFISLNDLAIKIFYAKNNSTSNLLYGGINIGSNIAISIFLVEILGHTGLALGTSLSAILVFPLYMWKLSKEMNGFKCKKHILKIIKVFIACSIMGGMLMLPFNVTILGLPKESMLLMTIKLLLQFLYSAILYMSILKILKVKEIDDLLIIKNKLFRKKAL